MELDLAFIFAGVIALAVLLYRPILLSDPGSLVANRFVTPVPYPEFLRGLPGLVSRVGASWTWRWWLGAVVVVVGAVVVAVAAACVNQLGFNGDELAELRDEAEAPGGVDIENRAACDRVMGEIVAGEIEKAEASRPPAAAGVDVGAEFQKHIQHLATLYPEDGRRIERANGFV